MESEKILGGAASRITGLPEGGTFDAAEWLREKESDPLNVPAFGREDRGGFGGGGICGLVGISFYVCRSYGLVLSAFFMFFFFLFFLFFFLGRLGSHG